MNHTAAGSILSSFKQSVAETALAYLTYLSFNTRKNPVIMLK